MVHIAQTSKEREYAFSDSEFKFLSELVSQHTGIVLADHKRDMVYSRLARRLRALGLQSFAEYCELVQGEQGGEEMGNLVNAITTNLTSFFREAHHFEHLKQQVITPLATKPERKLRIWSSACSSGMEPYSIAMAMKSALPNIEKWDAKILATDIDTNMLRVGLKGEYAASEYKNISDIYQKYVTKQDDKVHVADELKDLISFKYLNLLQAWPMKGEFDAIFCRNVVIYFDKPTQRKLFDRMADRLKPGGWLYIGHSENLNNVCNRFELCGRTIYRRIK